MPVQRVRRLSMLFAVLAGASVAWALPSVVAGATGGHSPAVVSRAGIGVFGNRLYRDGAVWIPRGVQIVGLVAPEGALRDNYVAAHAHFSADEMRAAVAAHADVVRFQVSQFGLDPQGPLYSPAYVQQVQDGIQTARALGLAVIVSLQAEAPAGEPVRCPLPDAGAERAWNELAPMFAGDSDVMFELYNEPAVGTTQTGWLTWLYGGPVTNRNGTCDGVGVQTLIDDIRSAGANNVIVVPGVAGEQSLAGMPAPSDPANLQYPQLAYGIHYPNLRGNTVGWDRAFGRTSASFPVILTEWNANSIENCLTSAPTQAKLLVNYLAGKGIGVVGFAFDLPGTLIADWSYAPTSYANFACGVPGGGDGQLLFDEFAAYSRTGDGSASGPAPAWMISAAAAKRLSALAPARAARMLNTPRAFVTGAGAALLQRLALPSAVATATFTDERKLAVAVNRGRLPAGTTAVLYDVEDSGVTPKAQQVHPGRYFQLAAKIVHSHNLLLLTTAATGLAAKLAPHTPPTRESAAFVRLGIAAAAARYADAYEIQAQSVEQDPAQYASFVRSAGAQAGSAHPGVQLFAALSTNPQGRPQPASVLLQAAATTPSPVSGYALEDPTRGKACPTCSGPYPRVALRVVDRLGAFGG